METASSENERKVESQTQPKNKKNQLELKDADDKEKWSRLKGGIFLSSVTGFSILAGFSYTMGMTKKSDPDYFLKGLAGAKELPEETGAQLASRALARATVYTVGGFSLVCFAIWKMMGVHSLEEFRYKLGSALPSLSRKEATGRSEFTSIRDLFEYIIEEDEKTKRLKKDKAQDLKDSSSSSS